MRILIVALDFPPTVGGIQEWTYRVALDLATRHEVVVVAPRMPGDDAFDRAVPFRVVRYTAPPSRPLALLALGLVLQRVIRRERVAVVFYAHIFAAVAAPVLHRLTGVPFVVSVYGKELQARGLQRFMPRISREASAWTAISTYTADQLAEKGVAPSAISLVGVGVSETMLATPSHDGAGRWLSGRPGPVILTVSRLDERYKGHDMLLAALPLVAARVPDVTLVVAGDGALRPYYAALAEALGVGDRVVFTGRVTDEERLSLYDRCTLFALLSRAEANGNAEGFGIVFLEAAARGKPSVGGRSGGIPDAVVDGETGLLVDPTSLLDIVEAIVTLLEDSARAYRLGEKAKERAASTYTWAHVAARVEVALCAAADSAR